MRRRVRILIAEDNAADVLLVRDALDQQNIDYELLVAEDGDAVRSLLAGVGPDVPRMDLLLLDLNLPRVHGPELFRLVRQHPLCAEIPLVVVTSSDSPRDRAWTEQFGAVHYFRKPSSYDAYMELGEIVRLILGGGAC